MRSVSLTLKGEELAYASLYDRQVTYAMFKVATCASTLRLVNKCLCHHVMDGMDYVEGDAKVAERTVDRILGLFNGK